MLPPKHDSISIVEEETRALRFGSRKDQRTSPNSNINKQPKPLFYPRFFGGVVVACQSAFFSNQLATLICLNQLLVVNLCMEIAPRTLGPLARDTSALVGRISAEVDFYRTLILIFSPLYQKPHNGSHSMAKTDHYLCSTTPFYGGFRGLGPSTVL